MMDQSTLVVSLKLSAALVRIARKTEYIKGFVATNEEQRNLMFAHDESVKILASVGINYKEVRYIG